jgi:hypothetical protein
MVHLQRLRSAKCIRRGCLELPWEVEGTVQQSYCSVNRAHVVTQVPAIIYLERVDSEDTLDLRSLPSEMDPLLLCQDTSISQ